MLNLNTDVPVVVMKFGKNLNPDDIEEGDDVYFECIIKANPSAYKVVWKLNVSLNSQIFHHKK